MNKTRFSKKLLSVVLSCACVLSSFAFGAASTASAVTTTDTATTSVQPTTGDASTFSWDNASVYFLLTDRFKNGNTSNDHSYGRTLDANGSPVSGWSTAPGTFHGGDFAGITQAINDGYFTNLGVNALWISAPYEQIHGFCGSGDASGNFAHYSYHGYYVLDYTNTDANFGTKEEFKTMVDTAHAKGIRVVMDIVINHAGYNNLLDMEQYGYGTLKSGYENYKYQLTNVGGMHEFIDYTSSSWSKWWGAGWVRSGLPGYTAPGGSDTTMSLAGLPDFKTESSEQVGIPEFLKTKWTKEGTYNDKAAKYGSSDTVNGYLTKWLAEWVRTYGIDGFRCDTAKHVEMGSWAKLKAACTTALKEWKSENPSKKVDDLDFWMTGECWDHSIGWGYDSYYTVGGFDSMINFQFSGSGVPGSSSIGGIYTSYANSINNNDKFNQLTYISSHDSNLCRSGDMNYQGSAFLLLPGAVQIFYGDETNRPLVSGMPFDGNGGSGHSLRSDMNWSAVSSSATLAHWQKVGQFRNNHIAVGAGVNTAVSATSGTAFTRTYDKGEISDAVAACIGASANTNVSIEVGSLYSDGTTVVNAYDGTSAVVTGGKATFNSGANGTILIEGPTSTINGSVKGASSFYDKEDVTVSLKGVDSATATITEGDGSVETKTVVDGQTLTIGTKSPVATKITIRLQASSGDEKIDKTFTFTKKDPDAVISVYFDNSSYNWKTINAYIYDESGSTVVENAKWPGVEMTLDSKTGYYKIDVPDELTNGQVVFAESATSPNRYPADKQPGLAINGSSKLFSANNTWEDYTGPIKPTDPPTEPVTVPPTQPSITLVRGDANGDNKVTIADIVLIQRYLASAETLTETGLEASDVNIDGDTNTRDIVFIQRYKALFDDPYGIGEKFISKISPTAGPTSPTQAPTVKPTEAPTQAPTQSDKRTIEFIDKYKWGVASAYYWSASNKTMLTWPGTAMTKIGTEGGFDKYSITIPNDATMIIFNNNNGGQQTVDITIDTTKTGYYPSGGSGKYITVTAY